jgi:hypothetical protein
MKFIKQLKAQQYTLEHPRIVRGLVGQQSLLRTVDPTDQIDMQRVKDLQVIQNQDFFPLEELTDKQLMNWIGNKKSSQEFLVFGVAGSEKIGKGEEGELQGYVLVYFISKVEAKKYRKKGFLPEPLNGQDVLMVSYVKHPDAPEGQMASALRQVCAELAQLDYSFHTYQTAQEVKKMLGYSEDQVLEGAVLGEFNKREEEVSREGTAKPTQIVVASISPRNKKSIYVAESAGFEYKGEVEPTMAEDQTDHLYVLNWDLLQRKLLNQALLTEKDKGAFTEKNVQNINIDEIIADGC